MSPVKTIANYELDFARVGPGLGCYPSNVGNSARQGQHSLNSAVEFRRLCLRPTTPAL